MSGKILTQVSDRLCAHACSLSDFLRTGLLTARDHCEFEDLQQVAYSFDVEKLLVKKAAPAE